MDFTDSIRKVKKTVLLWLLFLKKVRNNALENIAHALKNNKKAIFEANQKDLEAAKNLRFPLR